MCPVKHRPVSFCFLQPCFFVTSPCSNHCRREFLHTLKQEHLY